MRPPRPFLPLITLCALALARRADGQRDPVTRDPIVPALSIARVGIAPRRTDDTQRLWAGESDATMRVGEPLLLDGGGRSRVLAGAASAFIPGLGSFYAGNARHGAVHLVIHLVAGTYVLAGSVSCIASWGGETDCPDETALNIAAVGWLVNWGWSIVSAVNDVSAFNVRR